MRSHAELLSYVCKHSAGKDLALMASIQNSYPPNKPFYAGRRGKVADEHPVANILQAQSKNKTPMCLYLNYKPSELELGMMWRAKIEQAYFIDPDSPNKIKAYEITTDGCHLIECEAVNTEFQKLADDNKENASSTMNRLGTFADDKVDDAIANPVCERNISNEIITILQQGLNNQEQLIDTRENRKVDEDYIRIVMELVNKSWNHEDDFHEVIGRVTAGNNIGAIMVSPDNQIIAWGLNYKGENKTFHAETMMIQRYLRENNTDKLPDGAKIYTSLQCCHMCAGHIANLGKNIKVTYAQEDPYFEGENALTRQINGCLEERTTLKYGEVFAQAVGDQNILDFLFDKLPNKDNQTAHTSPTRQLFARAGLDLELKHELLHRLHYAHSNEMALSSTLENGRYFLDEISNFTLSRLTSPANSAATTPTTSRNRTPDTSTATSPVANEPRSPDSKLSSSPFGLFSMQTKDNRFRPKALPNVFKQDTDTKVNLDDSTLNAPSTTLKNK